LDISLDVRVELGQVKMMVNDLLKLGQGSVIDLKKPVGEQLDIYIGDKLIARGEVVVADEKLGIRVTDIVEPCRAGSLPGLKESGVMDGITGFDFIGSGVKAVAALCFVLALMVLLLAAMKKMTFYRQRGQKDLMIRRISSMPLSAKERIDVVEVSGQRLVLGVAQSGNQPAPETSGRGGGKGESR
jgi:flagellar motor switch protein FliN